MEGLTTLLLIKWIVLFSISIVTAIFIGNGISNLLNYNSTRIENISIGFVTYIGILQLVGWPFVAYRLKMSYFCILALVVLLGLLIVGYKYKTSATYKSEERKIPVFAIVTTLILIGLTFVLYRSDADDSFYVGNAVLFQNSSMINAYDSSFGIKSLGTVPMYDFQIWECLLAVIAKLFHVEAVTLMHTLAIPILLFCSASAYLFLGRLLTDGDERKASLFYMLLTLFHLMGGYAVYSEGSFLLSRLWQGKAVYLTVVLPTMIGILLKSLETEKKRWLAMQLLVCMLAGMALNPTSLYVMGFQLIFMMLVIAIVRKDKYYLLSSIPSVIMVAAYSILIYLRASKFSGQIEASSSVGDTFIRDTFIVFFGSGFLYFGFFLAAVVIILLLGNKKSKIYFVYTPLALLVGIWNPWTGPVVAEVMTKAPSYWRVFWLLPVGAAISYAIILLCSQFTKHKVIQGIVMLLGVLAILVPGKWLIGSETGFIKSNNVEKVPDETISFGRNMLNEKKNPIVLACDELATTLRQKYTDIELIYSRGQYVLDLFQYRGEQEQSDDRFLMGNFANGTLEDISSVGTVLQKYKVDYVILRSDNATAILHLNELGWNEMESSEKYIVFHKE